MTALDRVIKARYQAAQKAPYLAQALWAMTPVERPECGTMAVDESWRLYYAPDFVKALQEDETAAVLAHEVWHLLRNHAVRRGERDPRAWNVAADAEINDDLAADGWKLPGNHISPDTLGKPQGLTAEEYYDDSPSRGAKAAGGASEEQSAGAPSLQEPGPGGDCRRGRAPKGQGSPAGASDQSHAKPTAGRCGSGATGQPEPWELPAGGGAEGTPSVTPQEAELLRRVVAQAVRQCGSAPAGAKRWADVVLRPSVVDWRRELAACVRQSAARAVGAVDYSYRRPHRRRDGEIVMPSLVGPVVDIAVVVDTSGSVGDTELADALSEVVHISRAAGGRVVVIPCDAEAYGQIRLQPGQDPRRILSEKMQGGGGTDMGAGLAAAAKIRPRPPVVVVITDGETPWPDSPPAGQRVIVLTSHKERGPQWAKTLKI